MTSQNLPILRARGEVSREVLTDDVWRRISSRVSPSGPSSGVVRRSATNVVEQPPAGVFTEAAWRRWHEHFGLTAPARPAVTAFESIRRRRGRSIFAGPGEFERAITESDVTAKSRVIPAPDGKADFIIPA